MEWRLPWVPAQLERARVYDVDTRGGGGRSGAHTARLGLMSKGSLQSRKNIIWMVHSWFPYPGGQGGVMTVAGMCCHFQIKKSRGQGTEWKFHANFIFFFFDGFYKRWVQYISSESIFLSSRFTICEENIYLGISCRAWRVTGSRGSWVAWWGTWWRSWVPRRWRWRWCVVTRHPLMLRTEML